VSKEVVVEPCVRREIVLPETPTEVWEALTDPDRLEEWFANEVELDLERGEGLFRWEDGSERRVSIDVLDPERRLGFRWTDEDGAETRVDFTLVPDEEGTRLVVVEQDAEWSTALEMRACLTSSTR
jgi:uncharacterized protein YndB with AHSA1/START domain